MIAALAGPSCRRNDGGGYCKFDRCSNLASKLPVRRYDRGTFGECRCSEPGSSHRYAHGSRGSVVGVLDSATDGAVASRHADHGADELQAQRRPIRTAKDHFSIEGSVGDGRSSYRIAAAQMFKRCASLPFTEALGNAVAGQPLTMTFVDDREQPPDSLEAGSR